MKTIQLSSSKVSTYENCPRQYFYQYVLRVRSLEESVHLGFGTAIDEMFEGFVSGLVSGVGSDPVALFEASWNRFLKENVVAFSAKFTAADLTETGRALASQLPAAWEEAMLMPVLDREGKAIMQRSLSVDVGHGVLLNTKLDLLAMNIEGDIGIIDVKAPASESTTLFTLNAEQLTGYQAVVNAHTPQFGIDKPKFVAYWEFLKKKVPGPKSKKGYEGPKICRPHPVPARSDADIDEYVGKLHSIADNIRAKRFYKSPRMAFNTPCNMCAFARLCVDRDTSGYVLPKDMTTEQLVAARPTG